LPLFQTAKAFDLSTFARVAIVFLEYFHGIGAKISTLVMVRIRRDDDGSDIHQTKAQSKPSLSSY
jgi:hypothetical protein